MIQQYHPVINRERLAQETSEYILGDGYFTEFKKTEEFQKEIAKHLNVKHCFMMNNGTISLSIGLLALGIKPGDFVIVPNTTMIATGNAVRLIGAIPLFIDVDRDTGCLNLDETVEMLENYKIQGVIYVTLNGRKEQSWRYNGFIDYCKDKNIAVLEDNAQSLGSCDDENKKISCPEYGIGSFSFSMPKIITTGQGGCLVTNDDELAKKIYRLKDFGRSGGGNDVHDYFGINCKFTEIQAIMGLNQLKSIENRIFSKKHIYDLYESLLNKESDKIMIPRKDYHTPWFVDIYVEKREALISHLKEFGVQTRPVYPAVTSQKCTEEIYGKSINSDYFGTNGLWLPSSIDITDDEIKYICLLINGFYGR